MIKSILPKRDLQNQYESLSMEFFSHGCIGALASIYWFIWQDLQDFTVISVSLSIFGHHT